MSAIDDGDNILITGGAGVGKTYHTNLIIDKLKAKNLKFAVCAMTGLASQHLNFGITLHRFLQSGGATSASEIDSLLDNKFFIENLSTICHVSAIIIDEVSMMRPDYLELMDLILKEARMIRNIQTKKLFDPNELKPFGGYQIIMVGDFCQLPPVVKKTEKVPCKWIFQHKLFSEAQFRVYNLTETKRTSDPLFADTLNKIRVGYFDAESASLLSKRKDASLDSEGIVLMSKVSGVDFYNSQRLKGQTGEEVKLQGIISIREELKENEKLVKKLYHTILKESGLDKEITLKIGCKVMILSNNNVMNFSNGSQGTLLGTRFIDELNNTFKSKSGLEYDLDFKFFGECLHVLLDTGEDVLVPRKPFYIYSNHFDEKGRRIIDLTYYQYPITLGYAVSIHKSQGMSLDNMILDCANIFAEGQFYVGISRARSLQGLSILNFNPYFIRADQEAVNFYLNISGSEQGMVYGRD